MKRDPLAISSFFFVSHFGAATTLSDLLAKDVMRSGRSSLQVSSRAAHCGPKEPNVDFMLVSDAPAA